MTDIFVGEYGKDLYIQTGLDMSSATGIEVHFSAPSGGTSFVNSASVSVLAANYTASGCGIFSADKTALYTINTGDIDIAGTWKVWLQVDFGSTKRLISSTFRFKAADPG
jgi:hypothetical protein